MNSDSDPDPLIEDFDFDVFYNEPSQNSECNILVRIVAFYPLPTTKKTRWILLCVDATQKLRVVNLWQRPQLGPEKCYILEKVKLKTPLNKSRSLPFRQMLTMKSQALSIPQPIVIDEPMTVKIEDVKDINVVNLIGSYVDLHGLSRYVNEALDLNDGMPSVWVLLSSFSSSHCIPLRVPKTYCSSVKTLHRIELTRCVVCLDSRDEPFLLLTENSTLVEQRCEDDGLDYILKTTPQNFSKILVYPSKSDSDKMSWIKSNRCLGYTTVYFQKMVVNWSAPSDLNSILYVACRTHKRKISSDLSLPKYSCKDCSEETSNVLFSYKVQAQLHPVEEDGSCASPITVTFFTESFTKLYEDTSPLRFKSAIDDLNTRGQDLQLAFRSRLEKTINRTINRVYLDYSRDDTRTNVNVRNFE